jgi:cation-dependent mannose-6-phosphate receptor
VPLLAPKLSPGVCWRYETHSCPFTCCAVTASSCCACTPLTCPSFLIAFLTWFFGHTLYNRFYLKRRGLAQFPLPSFTLPKLSAGSIRNPFTRAEPSRPRFGFGRRSRAGYANVRADEGYDEEDGFAGRFSLEDDEDAEDLTGEGVQVGANAALGEETDAWRGAGAAGVGRATNGTTVGGGGGGGHGHGHGSGKPKLGAHQGLVDI